jgi:hypothetical protein
VEAGKRPGLLLKRARDVLVVTRFPRAGPESTAQKSLDKKGGCYYILGCRPRGPLNCGPPDCSDIPKGGDHMPAKKKIAKKKKKC